MLVSCNNVHNNATDGENVNDTLNIVKYAENFKVYPFESGHRLVINNNSLENNEFYLFNDTVDVPEGLSNKQIIRTPVKSVVAFSSTHWSVFQKLGEIEKVKGILESNYTANNEILKLVAEGKMLDVGMSTNVNVEKIIHLQPDVI